MIDEEITARIARVLLGVAEPYIAQLWPSEMDGPRVDIFNVMDALEELIQAAVLDRELKS